MKKIDINIQCPLCNGTGVYVGMAERDGAAVVCLRCKGTGEYNYVYEYEDFTGRKEKEGVKRVYKKGYGFCIAPIVIHCEDGSEIDMRKEGVSYEEFLSGKTPEHTKTLACPMLADQATCHKIDGFIDDCDSLNGGSLLGLMLTKCENQKNKANCWKRFEGLTANVE